jgi:hypothetical protein
MLGGSGNATVCRCDDWSKNVDEYVFVESVLLVMMVALAFFFETLHEKIHHHLAHKVAHADQMDHDESKSDIIERGHTPGIYMLRLLERLSSELMVLGFIAFTVWACNKGGVFERSVNDGYGPPTGSDLLHVVEDIHMHLFMAMVYYFFVMRNVATNVESSIRRWDNQATPPRLLPISSQSPPNLTHT